MTSGLFNIVRKEVREMVRDPRMLLAMTIFPIIIFPVMGAAMSASLNTVEQSARIIDLGIIDLDHGNYSEGLINFMVTRGVHDEYYNYNEAWTAINDTATVSDVFLFIMPGFTADIEHNRSGRLILCTPLSTYSITEAIPSDIVQGYLVEYRQKIVDMKLLAAYPGQNIQSLENPVYFQNYSVIDGAAYEIPPATITNQMMGQSLMIPIVLMMLLVMGVQLAATSVAMEKEEKTLETLLTTPVSRHSILFGKIMGVVVISAIAMVAYGLGFSVYMSSMSRMAEQSTVSLAALGLVPTAGGMIILMVTLFLSLVAALSLAVLVASFTEDVRSAQALMSVIYAPIFLPVIVLMLVDISQLPGFIQAGIYAIPFSYPVLAAKALYTGQFTVILWGIIYQVIFTTITIYGASWLFSSEKILTVRINIRGMKGGSGGPVPAILSRVKGRRRNI